MNQAALLYNLQLLDTHITQINQNIKQIETVLMNNQAVDIAKVLLGEAEKQLEKSSKELKIIEEKANSLQIKIDQSNSSLYGGSIKIPKELKALQDELQSLRKRMAALEEQQLDQMLLVEEHQSEMKTREQHYHQSQAEDSGKKSSLRGEADQLRKTLEKLNVERQAVCTSISPANLQLYKFLREKKRGIAVAKNIDTSCSVCGALLRPSEIQLARTSDDLSICESCGRIIFSE